MMTKILSVLGSLWISQYRAVPSKTGVVSLVSVLISVVATTVVGLLVTFELIKKLDVRADQVAFIMAITSATSIIFTIPAGIIADTRSPRTIITTSFLIQTFTCLMLLFVLHSYSNSIYCYAVAIFIIKACLIFFEVCISAIIPRMISKEDMVRFNGYHQAVISIALLVGPTLAGFMGDLIEFSTGLVLIAILFLVGVIAGLVFFKNLDPPVNPEDKKPSSLDGIKILINDNVQFAITKSAAIFNFFHAMLFVLFPVFVIRQLDFNTVQVGMAFAAAATAGAVFSFFSERVIERVGSLETARLSLVLVFPASIPLLLSFLMPSYSGLLVSITLSCWEVLVIANIVAEATIMQLRTPADTLGSVASASRLVSWGVDPFGAFLGGVLVLIFSLKAVILLAIIGMGLSAIPLFIVRPVE